MQPEEVTTSHTGVSASIINDSKPQEKWRKKIINLAQSLDHPSAALWNRRRNSWVENLAKVAVGIVRLENQENASLEKTSSLSSEFRGKLTIPNITDFRNRELVQRLFVLDPSKDHVLLKSNARGVVDIDKCDNFIESLADLTIKTAVINYCKLWYDCNEYKFHSRIFAGSAAPSLDDLKSAILPDLGLEVHYGMA
jgi:hypothetical protein